MLWLKPLIIGFIFLGALNCSKSEDSAGQDTPPPPPPVPTNFPGDTSSPTDLNNPLLGAWALYSVVQKSGGSTQAPIFFDLAKNEGFIWYFRNDSLFRISLAEKEVLCLAMQKYKHLNDVLAVLGGGCSALNYLLQTVGNVPGTAENLQGKVQLIATRTTDNVNFTIFDFRRIDESLYLDVMDRNNIPLP